MGHSRTGSNHEYILGFEEKTKVCLLGMGRTTIKKENLMTALYLATNRVNFTPSGHLQIVREQANGFYEEIEVQTSPGIPVDGGPPPL